MTLCLISQQPFHTELAVSYLKKEGFEVIVAENFDEAVEARGKLREENKYFSLCIWLRPDEGIATDKYFLLLQIAPNATSAYFAKLYIEGLEKFLAHATDDDNYGF